MPRPFDVETDSPAGVEAILRAFGDESYWNARITEFGGGATTLDALEVDADGAVAVATTQDLRNDLLPGPLTKVFRGNLSIVRTETWRRDGAGVVVYHRDERAPFGGCCLGGPAPELDETSRTGLRRALGEMELDRVRLMVPDDGPALRTDGLDLDAAETVSLAERPRAA